MRPEDLIGADTAAKLLGIGRVTFWRRRSAGRYPAPIVTIGNRPLFIKDQILAAAEQENVDAH